jgi:hypothetical protein
MSPSSDVTVEYGADLHAQKLGSGFPHEIFGTQAKYAERNGQAMPGQGRAGVTLYSVATWRVVAMYGEGAEVTMYAV